MYQRDTSDDKVNFSIGSYKQDNGATALFEAVKKAEQIVAEKTTDKDYAVYAEDEYHGKKEFVDAV